MMPCFPDDEMNVMDNIVSEYLQSGIVSDPDDYDDSLSPLPNQPHTMSNQEQISDTTTDDQEQVKYIAHISYLYIISCSQKPYFKDFFSIYGTKLSLFSVAKRFLIPKSPISNFRLNHGFL